MNTPAPLPILFLAEEFPPDRGGIAEFNLGLADALQQHGCKVTVIAPRTSAAAEVQSIEQHLELLRVGAPDVRKASLSLWKRYCAIRNTHREVSLHVTKWRSQHPNGIAIVSPTSSWGEICLRANLRFGLFVHGADAFGRRSTLSRTLFRYLLVRRLLHGTPFVFANSKYTSDALSAFGARKRDARVVYCAVSEDLVHASSLVTDTPPEDTPIKLLCLSRLVAIKACDDLIRAFAHVRELFPATTLTIAGDGPERDALEQLSADLGLSNSIDFVGYVAALDKKIELLSSHHILVQAGRLDGPMGRAEAFGISYLEAALFRLPAVGPRLGGVPESVLDGVTGRLFEAGDVTSLADAISYLVANANERDRLGRVGRDRVLASFRYRRIAEDVLRHMQEGT